MIGIGQHILGVLCWIKTPFCLLLILIAQFSFLFLLLCYDILCYCLSICLFYKCWRIAWQSTPVFCLKNPMDKAAWWDTILGVTRSQTWLSKWACTHTYAYINELPNIYVYCPVPHKLFNSNSLGPNLTLFVLYILKFHRLKTKQNKGH